MRRISDERRPRRWQAPVTHSKEAWSDYWRREGRDGEVFVDADRRKHPALGEFWRARFADAASGERVVDLASGAGSIFASLPGDLDMERYAVDLSTVALGLLRDRFPGTLVVAGAGDRLPFADHSFDHVVSQFGIEYAGHAAFAEAARLVRPGGRLTVLAHYRDGAIDARTAVELAGARFVEEQGFVDLAVELASATAQGPGPRYEAAVAAFVPAERALAQRARRDRQGVHVHLYAGFRQLYERRQHYALGDILDWLDGMRGELTKVTERLGAMHAAAMTRADLTAVEQALHGAGLCDVSTQPFTAATGQPPVAWYLAARRA
jgi:SAM-dependent methyltransferase